MKILDVVNVLAARIPLFTDDFSVTVGVVSITPNGNIATVVTDAPHQLEEGQHVAFTDVITPIEIDTVARIGTFATVTTLQDHDLTLSQKDKALGGKVVTLQDVPGFSGQFQLLNVNNRREFVIEVPETGATNAAGGLLIDPNFSVYKGLFTATNVGGNTFDFVMPRDYTVTILGGRVATAINVAGCLDIARYVEDIYTKKEDVTQAKLVVQLGDVTRSKNRNETSDASDSNAGEYYYDATLIQPFAIYIIQNVTQELDGVMPRDRVECEYVPAIFKSIERQKFDSCFTESRYGATFTEHGVFFFDTKESQGTALYVHEVAFEQKVHLSACDTIDSDFGVAMRDVNLDICLSTGTKSMLADIDLDEKPLN